MRRLVRIIIYAIAILLVYFIVINTVDTYMNKSDLVIPVASTVDKTSQDTIQTNEDSLGMNEGIVTDGDIVSGEYYDILDKKVFELEEHKSDENNKSKKQNETVQQDVAKDKQPKTNPTPRQTQPTGNIAHSDPDGKFLVMAGSFLLKENADALVSKLHKLGYQDAKIVIFQASQYHSVLAAKYNSEENARAISTQLSQKGIDNFVKIAQ